MTVGILKISLFLPNSNSLKEKRMILHSLKARLRNSFNIAVTQLEDNDKWQRSFLAIVGVQKDKSAMHTTFQGVLNYIENFHQVNLIDYEMEMI